MALKLKSITRQIHWSLLARAVVFVLSWLYLPFWLFVLFALYCYCVPWFQARKLALPFFALLILCFGETPGLLMAFIFGALFYYLLITKDLLLIDRKFAHALLLIALSFFLFRDFYARFDNGPVGIGLLAAFFVAGLFGLLVGDFTALQIGLPKQKTIGFLAFLIMAQFLIAGLFLPVDFIYQSTVVFLVAVLCVDLLPEQSLGTISPEKIRATSLTIFSLLVITLAAARWGL